MQIKRLKKNLILGLTPPKSFTLPIEEWPAAVSHMYNFKNEPEIFSGLFSGKIGREELGKLIKNIGTEFTNVHRASPHKDKKNYKFKFIDLFAGIGGFRLSLNKQGGKCVFSSEWDQAAQDTYFKNYGEIPFGDLTQFTGEDVSDYKLKKLLPDHDILAAGFPCQPFSRAGVSARNSLNQAHGFNCESQGTLFYDVARIINIKKPRAVFLENVRNLQSHDSGRTFGVIKRTIEELGYHFTSVVINSNTKVPQNRQRCYMIAVKKKYKPFIFDMSCFGGEPIPLKTILNTNKEEIAKYQISEALWRGHQERTERNVKRGTGFRALEADINKPSNTLVARYGKDGKECLIPMNSGPPRKLTKREAAKLQGYPDTFILPDSKTPTYRQMGNSVSVPVVKEISRQLIKHLEVQNGL